MSSKYEQIKNMSLIQLKKEYNTCSSDDTVKKQILKKIIKNKLEIEKKNKKLDNDMKNDIDTKLNNLIKAKENTEKDKKAKKVKELDQIIKKRGNMEQYWENTQTLEKIDDRFKPEIEHDHANNKLMERLNFELDFRIHGEKTKDVIKPYSNQDGGNYKDFEKYSIPTDNFETNKILRKRHIH